VKLILANNQTERFVSFYNSLREQSTVPFEYAGYATQLFIFAPSTTEPIRVIDTKTGKSLHEYDGVYINGYLNTYELAATIAICCDALGVAYINKEMHDAPSLSKLTMYAKLVAAGVDIPYTLCGTKKALLQSEKYMPTDMFPAILKRADADRGIDNFKVQDYAEAKELVSSHDEASLWVLQKFIDNDGFYVVSFYDSKPAFCIFRTLQERPDGNVQKSHMYKPKGGANASLIDAQDIPRPMLDVCLKAVKAMNRQIGSVDCIFNPTTQAVHVLEVNYNPQLVTIETFKDIRVKAYLENLEQDWS